MRKINLKAKNLSNRKSKGYSGQSSLIIGVVLLFLAAGLYGGVFYLKSKQDKETAIIKTDIQQLKNGLDGNKEYKELYDFQDRLLEIEHIFKNKVVQSDLLDQISETTMNKNTLQNLKITMDNGLSDINLTTQVADLNILAKQLKAYSQVDADKQALLRGSSLKEDSIEASIEFSIESLNSSANKNDNSNTTINR